MKKVLMLVVLLGMFGWAIFDLVAQSENSSSSNEQPKNNSTEETMDEDLQDVPIGLNVGERAPDFHLETLSGESVRLSDLRGKRVMINFWATWCPPCRAEMPDMEKFYNSHDVEILAINLTQTESRVNDIKSFVDEFSLTFPILLDEELEAGMLYQIQPIPTSFMVDSRGIIQFKTIGPMNYDMMVQEFEKMK
ncbi:redoxin domain-containing protein [Bacillaceae bacterium W0354]